MEKTDESKGKRKRISTPVTKVDNKTKKKGHRRIKSIIGEQAVDALSSIIKEAVKVSG